MVIINNQIRMKLNYKIINKKNLYKGFFELNEFSFKHKRHDGKWSNEIKREIFSGAQVATLLPYDPVKNEILLIQQFRAGIIGKHNESYIYEIVAGIIDSNETPEQTARRECFEETGCKVKKITPIHNYFPAPGSSESFYYLYIGEIESFKGTRIHGLKNEGEDILVTSFKVDEVKEMLNNNKIINAISLIALQWFFLSYYKN